MTPVLLMQLFAPLATRLILSYNYSYTNIHPLKLMSFKPGISKQLTAVVQNVCIGMHIHEYFITITSINLFFAEKQLNDIL